MKKTCVVLLALLCSAFVLLGQSPNTAQSASSDNTKDLRHPNEKHLRNVRQLTFGGENAEAYFSADDKQLIFQSAHPPYECDQIFVMNIDGTGTHLVSTGKGRTTCSYFFPDGKHILYSSTHGSGPNCPPPPDYKQGYRWALYPEYEIYVADADGKNPRNISNKPGYDAEATISRDGKKIVFTSMRSGDLEIYTMDADGTNVKQLTNELGYDGGPFFSADGKWIVYRAYHPKSEQEVTEYKELIKRSQIKPINLEIWVMKADGSEKHQVTKLGSANFAPFFFPNGKRIIFATNHASGGGMGNFDIYAVDIDGKNLEQITFNESFDGFPMFTKDGKKLVFASNRNQKTRGETNVFIADWVD